MNFVIFLVFHKLFILHLLNRRRDPLPNHVATVNEYLNKYKTLDSKEEQTKMFKRFTHYIVACCWRKMRRRMTSWSSQGYFYCLGRLSEHTVQQLYRVFAANTDPLSKRKDSALYSVLTDTLVQEVMGEYLEKDQDAQRPKDSLLPNLRKALQASNQASNSPNNTAYNADTCVEFHQLLVATLTGYGKALRLISEAYQKDDQEGLLNCAHRLWRFTHLLWRIAYSRMLRYHLSALDAGDVLVTPLNAVVWRGQYFDYARNAGMVVKLERGGRKQDPDENNEGQEDDDEDLEDEENRYKKRPEEEVKCTSYEFHRWIRLQVIHFQALEILTSFRTPSQLKHTLGIDISLLAVKPSPAPPEHWKTTLRKLARDPQATPTENVTPTVIDFDAVETLLERRIRDPIPPGQEGRFTTILEAFRSQKFRFSFSVHCEAALAALTKFVDHAITTPKTQSGDEDKNKCEGEGEDEDGGESEASLKTDLEV